MRRLAWTILAAVTLFAPAGTTEAADIRLLSVRAPAAALRAIAADFARETGHRVVFTVDSTAGVMQRIKANEVHDAVVVSEPAMDGLDREGIVNPESRARLANTGIGVAARAGAAAPNLANAEAFKQALLAAKSIVYGEVFPHAGGDKVEKILAAAGILDGLKPKLKSVPDPAEGLALVARGEAELALYQLGEIVDGKGVTLAGAVPAPLQLITTYEAALMSDGAAVEATRAFIAFLANADARPRWSAAHFEPLADH